MLSRTVAVLSLLCVASPAFAAADPSVTLTTPVGKHVYEAGRYTVTVKNIGNKDAASVVATIQLPQTHTSPQVYVMGTVGAKSTSCTLSGRTITCALGTVTKNNGTKSVWFDLSLPQNSVPLTVSASITTTSVENSGGTANNSTTRTPTLVNYAVAVGPTFTATNDHCTGTGLTSFFECELFPSSIASHETVFNADHTITFVGQAGYTGDWVQTTSNQLHFRYFDDTGATVAEFEGRGVTPDCFEGLTTFGSPYVSPYQVCFQ